MPIIVSKDQLPNLINVIEKLKLKYKVFHIINVEAFIGADVDDLLLSPGDLTVYVYVIPKGKNILLTSTEKEKLKKIS